MTHVAVIYDASYLMTERGALHESWPLKHCNVTSIVSNETVKEIANHLSSRENERRKRASDARRKILELRRGQDHRLRYVELAKPLAGHVVPYRRTDLGPDSVTDRLLVGYGTQLAAQGGYDAVVLASNDHGFPVAVSELRSAERLPIFFIPNPKNEKDPELRELGSRIEFGLSQGPWRPKCILEIPTSKAQRHVVLSAGADVLASVDADEEAVHWWSRATAARGPLATFPMRGRKHIQCAISPDGTTVLVLSTVQSDGMAEKELAALRLDGWPAEYGWAAEYPKRLERSSAIVLGSGPAIVTATAKGSISLIGGSPWYQEVTVPGLNGEVQSIAINANGARLAVGTVASDRSTEIQMLSPADGVRFSRLSSKSVAADAISVMEFAPNGEFLAVGSQSGEIKIWNVRNGSVITRRVHRNRIKCLAFGTDSEILAFGLENASPNVGLLRPPEFMDVTMLSDVSVGKARLNSGMLRFGHSGQTLHSDVNVWRVPDRKHLLSFLHPLAIDRCISLRGDLMVTADSDKYLRIWRLDGKPDVLHPEHVLRVRNGVAVPVNVEGETRPGIRQLFAVGSGREAAALLSDVHRQLDRLKSRAPRGGDGGMRADWFRILRAGVRLTGEQRDWQRFWATDGSRLSIERGTDGVRDFIECALSYAPDTTIGTAIRNVDTSEFQVFRPSLRGELRRLGPEIFVLPHSGNVAGVMELSNGRILSWSDDGRVHVWSSAGEPATEVTYKSRRPHTLDRLLSVARCRSGRILARSDMEFQLWSPDCEPIGEPLQHENLGGAIELKDRRLLSWSRISSLYRDDLPCDGAVRLWSPSGELLHEIFRSDETTHVYKATELSSGRILISHWGGRYEVWPPDQGADVGVLLSGHDDYTHGPIELSNRSILTWSKDGTLRRWSEEGQPIGEAMRGHTRRVNGALELAGGRIVSWSDDKTLRLWSLDGTAIGEPITGHKREVGGIVELSTGRLLSSSDNELLLRDREGKILKELFRDDSSYRYLIGHAKELPGGRIVCNIEQRLQLWSMDGEPIGNPIGRSVDINDEYIEGIQLANGQILSWWPDMYPHRWPRNQRRPDHVLQLWTAQGEPVGAPMRGHWDSVNGAIELRNGIIASWSADGTVRFWSASDVPTRNMASILDGIELDHGGVLSWSDDNDLQLWSPDGMPRGDPILGHSDTVWGAIELSSGRLLSWSEDGTLLLWMPHPEPMGKALIMGDPVWGAIELSNGDILSWSKDALQRWSTEGDRIGNALFDERWQYSATYGLQDVRQLRSGRILVWFREDEYNDDLVLWSAEGVRIGDLLPTGGRLSSLAELANERILVVEEGAIWLWTPEGELITALSPLENDGSRLIPTQLRDAIGLSDGRFLLWCWENPFRRLWSSPALWSPDGKPLMKLLDGIVSINSAKELSSGHILSWSYRKFQLWNPSGEPIAESSVEHLEDMMELSSGRILSKSSNELRLWDADGKASGKTMPHQGLTGVKELPDGRILSWAADNSLGLWDANGEALSRHILWFGKPLLVTSSLMVLSRTQLVKLGGVGAPL